MSQDLIHLDGYTVYLSPTVQPDVLKNIKRAVGGAFGGVKVEKSPDPLAGGKLYEIREDMVSHAHHVASISEVVDAALLG
jgi:hypothetical protein